MCSMQDREQNQEMFDRLAPANIIASYKTFRVVIRDQGKLVPVACVGGNLGLDAFMQDVE